jgi:hypothetical protein
MGHGCASLRFKVQHDLTIRNCWICGKLADSREHKTKRSDLKGVFGDDINVKGPIHYRSDVDKELIDRLDHSLLLFRKVICQGCNNSRTQKSDIAWERLFTYFRTKCWSAVPGEFLNLRGPFPNTTAISMLQVHLYFVKLLGCVLAEQEIPIPLERFSQAIMNAGPHPSIYLTFGTLPGVPLTKLAGVSELFYEKDGASWIYGSLPISVNVTYDPTHTRNAAMKGWHPRIVSDLLPLVAF